MSDPIHHTETSIPIYTPGESFTPIYLRYDGATRPQSAHLDIDLERKRADWEANPEVGNAVPSGVWQRVVVRVGCSPLLSRSRLEGLSADLSPLVDRVCGGGTVEWDGSNRVGVLDDDATEAVAEIERVLESEDGDIDEWEAGEWLAVRTDSDGVTTIAYTDDAPLRITSETTDDEIWAMVQRIDATSAGDGMILYGVEEHLLGLRRDARDAAAERGD